ncbi:MAG: 50S ribosomal protein L34e [Nanoarchaeota archaeon]
MPEPRFRSRKLRRIKVTTPGGENKTVYEKRKPSKAVCGNCKKPLHGVPRENPAKMRNMPKTKKRPERQYGGVLCNICSQKKAVLKAREDEENV